ncbi:HIT family protein [bacterium]|nr:HIT family protein [candidate division CSSED10-310 bacterium]
MDRACSFCAIIEKRESCIVVESELAVALNDAFPVSPGHMLVVPRRHIASFFDATEEEILACYRLIRTCRTMLDSTRHPDGYNIGINIGRPAGQTVFHLHIHVIPRYAGDVRSPRGGVRHVIHGKGDYLPIQNSEKIDPSTSGGVVSPIIDPR